MSATLTYATNDALGGLTRIYDAMLSELDGITLPIVQMAVFDACEEFCLRSNFWRQSFTVTMPAGMAFRDLNPLDATTLATCILTVSGYRRYQTRPPALLIDTSGDTTTDRTGVALVACKPRRLASFDIPDFLIADWGQIIREGAMMRLRMQPARPWSDKSSADYYGRRFRTGIFLAKEMVRRQGDLPWPGLPYFAQGSQRGWGVPMSSSISGFGAPESGLVQPSLPPDQPPLVLNDHAADVDGGDFNDDLSTFNDIEGGIF